MGRPWTSRVRACCKGATVLAVAVVAAAAGPAGAATIRVDSFKDKPDDMIADGNCEAANGDCTLRAAVSEASYGHFPGLDTIKLKAGTYKLKDVESSVVDTPDVDVLQPATIVGKGMGKTVVEQTADAAVFELYTVPGVSTMRKLTVKGGTVSGVLSRHMLVLDRVKLTGNEFRSSTSSAAGGALNSSAALSIIDSKIVGNRVDSSVMGTSAAGGGISHEAADISDTIEIQRSLIARNRATASGGANAFAGGVRTTGLAVIDQSTILGNLSDGAGGGMIHTGSDAGIQLLTVSRSAISANEAGSGGALAAFAPVDMENSTLSGNSVSGPGANGGAVYRAGGAAISLDHVTVAENQAPAGNVSGLLSDPSAGTLTLEATVIANPGIDCGGTGLIASAGYNVAEGTDCPLTATGDLEGADARLRPLNDNGGRTQTHKLRGGSDAKDAVTAGCPPPTADQRGIARPQGPECDAGAFEREVG